NGLPNTLQGVAILNSAQSNMIGGSAAGAPNSIWYNGQEGISLSDAATSHNQLTQNSIYNNGVRGIALYNNADGQLASPTITSAKAGSSDQNTAGTDITGMLQSTPNTTFVIEFFANEAPDPSGYGQGQTFIGNTSVTTDSKGNRGFTVQLPAAVPTGDYVTAKTTAPDGNSSSYSKVIAVTAADADKDGMPDKYETAYQLNPKNAADANLDSDGDGMTNLQEYRAGTNPRSAISRLVISSLDFATGSPRITF